MMFLSETGNSGVLSAILKIFTMVASWFVETLPTLTAIFYDSTTGSLTFLGVLAVAGLAFSVIFLVIGLIQRFLHFRG